MGPLISDCSDKRSTDGRTISGENSGSAAVKRREEEKGMENDGEKKTRVRRRRVHDF